jgi:Transposase DDE domain group 1
MSVILHYFTGLLTAVHHSFLDIFCLVVPRSCVLRAVVRFYNKRGTAEQCIKGGKQAVKMTRLSCHRFRSNEVRLWLNVIAYNLGHLWRRLALPKGIDHWSLTSVQQRLLKAGGRLVKCARYDWLWLAEGHLTRRVFGAMVRRIAALPVPAGELKLERHSNRSTRRVEGEECLRNCFEHRQLPG